MNQNKTLEGITQELRSFFRKLAYRIQRGEQSFVLYETENPKTELYTDEDGTILGKPNFQTNFFVFPEGKTISLSDWYIESLREWCLEDEWGVTRRKWTDEEQQALEYLRQYWSHSFVQRLLKNYSDVKIWDEDGDQVKLIDHRVIY